MDTVLNICMDILRAIATIRTPLLDGFFSLMTRLGEETVFIAVALLFFWCIDKRKGYYILFVGLAGSAINQWLKILCCVPRPWVLDPQFEIVESAREAATGFSFPSGHTQSAAGIGFSIARAYRKRWLVILCALLVLTVGFSRMYLGVHTPLDVAVSLLVALGLALLLYYPICRRDGSGTMPALVVALGLFSTLFLLYMLFAPMRVAADDVNAVSALKNAYTYLGTSLGFLAVCIFERRYVNFETKAVWWAQVLKLAVGLALLLAVKSLLKQPLLELMNGSGFSHTVRYFAAMVIGGGFYPMLFRFLPQKEKQ